MKKIFFIPIIFLAASCQKAAPSPIPPQPIACTMEAKPCSDGSYVSRTGPNCEFAACPEPKATTTPINLTSGISGQILLGPTCPVERIPPDPNCGDKPYQATVIVKSADGQKEITRFTSKADGTFILTLSPGIYLLVPVSQNAYPRGLEQTVTVNQGKYTQVTINFDSGIR